MGASRARKKKKHRIIIFTIEILLLLVVLAGLFVWSKYQKLDRQPDMIGTQDIINEDMNQSVQEVLKGYTNIALFGLDNRSNGSFEAGNSDVIMIASINNDTKEVRLVSVFRDTFLNVSSDGTNNFRKANYAYNKGGAEEAVRMLNRNLDLDIQDYVVVDFQAVTEAIDLLGGVEVEIDAAEAKWMDFYINETALVTGHEAHSITQPGTYTLDGVQATSYCRIRYTAGDDFKRAQRQREVIAKMVEKAKNADLFTINKIIDSVLDDISTNFTAGEMISLASQLMNYELADTTGFPFHLTTANLGGSKGSVVIPCDLVTNVTDLHKYLFNDFNYTPSNTVTSFSQAVIQETGKGADDAETTGVEADHYTKGSQNTDTGTDTDSDTAVSDTATQ
ncbi:MAG: LCP family protein [Eubacterium sp.]|jgi:LCP family protein required for cell wall assembly|nr:LCP family protein [Eubacterium sp.]